MKEAGVEGYDLPPPRVSGRRPERPRRGRQDQRRRQRHRAVAAIKEYFQRLGIIAQGNTPEELRRHGAP